MFRTLSAVFDVHFPWRFSENWACKKEKEKLLCNHHVISVVCTVIDHSSWPNRSVIVKYGYLSLWRTKKDIDSRLFFALRGVLEKWEMCPWKSSKSPDEFFVQKGYETCIFICYKLHWNYNQQNVTLFEWHAASDTGLLPFPVNIWQVAVQVTRPTCTSSKVCMYTFFPVLKHFDIDKR